MKQFDIERKGRDFEISENNILLAKLSHQKWSSETATIEIAGSGKFEYANRSLWKATAVVTEAGQEVLELKMKFSGNVVITPVKQAHHFFTVKHRGWFKQGYRLLNHREQEVATVTSVFTMSNMHTTYTLQCTEAFGTTDTEVLLLVLMVRHYFSMNSAAATVAASS